MLPRLSNLAEGCDEEPLKQELPLHASPVNMGLALNPSPVHYKNPQGYVCPQLLGAVHVVTATHYRLILKLEPPASHRIPETIWPALRSS